MTSTKRTVRVDEDLVLYNFYRSSAAYRTRIALNLKELSYRYIPVHLMKEGGQQFKAEAGQKLFVHHIQNAENGATVEFDKVLLVDKDGNVTVGAPTVDGAKVVCQIVSSLVKGDKVLVFHKKRRKGHRKLNGHRQQFTELTITEVVA